MTSPKTLAARLLATTATALLFGGTAYAQDGASESGESQTDTETQSKSGGLGDIVVTATRRATNVQDVPIAITAVGGEQLANQGITDGVQLARVVPNLFVTTGYAGGNPRFAIRGFGMTDFSQGGSSPVGLYVDDVYMTYNFGVGSQLFDLDRVEVLRGPQGTTFGKNTTAGVVGYFSVRPQEQFEGYLRADFQFGEYNKYTAEGMLNVPLSQDLSMRVDGRYERRDSYVRNVFDGSLLGENDSLAGRLQLRWRPGSNTDVNLKVYGMDSRGDATLYHGGFLQNICDPANFDPVNTFYANCQGTDLPPTYETPAATSDETGSFEKYHNYGAVLRVEQGFGDFDFTSISAYQKINYRILSNDDGNSTDFFHSRQELYTWQASQELRLATPAERPLSAVFGLFGQYDRARTPTATGSTALGPGFDYMLRADSLQKTTTLAAFASATWRLSDKISFIGGLRYSWEKKKLNLQGLEVFNFGFDFTDENMASFDLANPPFAIVPGADNPFAQVENRSWDRLTWDATLNYRPNEDILLYGKVAEGFRSGGFNLFAVTESALSTVNPEILRSYEIGAKTEFLDRRLRLNLAGFIYKISDQQILSTNSAGAGVILSNAGKSTIKGFEAELEAAPADRLRFFASLGYTDARFDLFNTEKAGVAIDLAGNRLAYAPEFTVLTAVTYEIPVGDYTLELHNDWAFRSKIYFDAFNLAVTGDDDFLQGNARITLRSPEKGTQWHIAAYISNLTNETNGSFAFFTGTAWYSRVFGDKRLWGIQAGVKF
jgi:iron complex outermembrane receptor protein